jgi:hypothetical protein
VGDADLGLADPAALSAYGQQFASAGWRLSFNPTHLHAGSHVLFVYAHSVVTGKENLVTGGFAIVENG